MKHCPLESWEQARVVEYAAKVEGLERDMSLPAIVDRKCLICDTEFKVKRKTVWKGGGKYCSNQCRYKGNGILSALKFQKNRVEKQCVVCKKYIYVKKSHEKIEGTYCSTECMAEGYKTRLKGKANPNFKNLDSRSLEYARAKGKEYRTKYPERTRIRNFINKKRLKTWEKADKNYIRFLIENSTHCYWCRNKIKDGDMHIDHYVPVAAGGGNNNDNLVPSCSKCNMKKKAKNPFMFANEIGRLL